VPLGLSRRSQAVEATARPKTSHGFIQLIAVEGEHSARALRPRAVRERRCSGRGAGAVSPGRGSRSRPRSGSAGRSSPGSRARDRAAASRLEPLRAHRLGLPQGRLGAAEAIQHLVSEKQLDEQGGGGPDLARALAAPGGRLHAVAELIRRQVRRARDALPGRSARPCVATSLSHGRCGRRERWRGARAAPR
jgi:hypothetical protein